MLMLYRFGFVFLILPTHRKLIKLLRDRANAGSPAIMLKKDSADFIELFKSKKQRGARHRGLYRITLRVLQRPPEEIEPEEIHAVLDNQMVNLFEKTLAKAEWRSLSATLTASYFIPLLRSITKQLERK